MSDNDLVYLDNGVRDYEDGVRLMTEGIVNFCGVRVARVGYYRLTADGGAYTHQDTVLLPFPGDGMRMRAGTLRSRVDAQRLAKATERC
jgi:hypothetical protein